MSTIHLHHSTENHHIDTILHGIIGLYETAFPGRVRAYYLFGSYANKSAVPISDIDMGIVFKGSFLDEMNKLKAQQINEYCSLLSPIRLDIGVAGEAEIPVEHVQLKLASVLLFGEDIRDTLPMPTIAAYLSYVSNWPHSFAALIHETNPIIFPLTYPDPQGEFYGYDKKRVAAWYPPSVESGTKELVAYVCWMATFIVGWKSGVFISRKGDAVQGYKECIDGDFGPLLDFIYHVCGQQWAYTIPERQSERQLLREMCSNVIAFENWYLLLYRDFLLDQLQSGDVAKQVDTVKRLGETVYVDEEISDILRSLAE